MVILATREEAGGGREVIRVASRDITKHWDTGAIECLRCRRRALTMRELADQPCP